MPYRKPAGSRYRPKRKNVATATLKTRKWGAVTYPKGTKPVVVEVKIEGLVNRRPAVQTFVWKEGIGIKNESEISELAKALSEKARRELPADQKAEFSIHLPKTREKPVKFVAVGEQPLEPRLVVPSGGFDIPDELREDIRKEWKKHPNRKTATDLEAMAHLMSTSALGPLDSEHTRIYLYLARKYLKSKAWRSFKGSTAFLNEYKSLSENEKRLLQKLKDHIWKLQQKDLAARKRHAKQLLKEVCPGGKIRSMGTGKGKGFGKGKGPVGVPKK